MYLLAIVIVNEEGELNWVLNSFHCLLKTYKCYIIIIQLEPMRTKYTLASIQVSLTHNNTYNMHPILKTRSSMLRPILLSDQLCRAILQVIVAV